MTENDDDVIDINDEESRFIVECEFVQALASPAYLQHLYNNSYFDDPGARSSAHLSAARF